MHGKFVAVKHISCWNAPSLEESTHLPAFLKYTWQRSGCSHTSVNNVCRWRFYNFNIFYHSQGDLHLGVVMVCGNEPCCHVLIMLRIVETITPKSTSLALFGVISSLVTCLINLLSSFGQLIWVSIHIISTQHNRSHVSLWERVLWYEIGILNNSHTERFNISGFGLLRAGQPSPQSIWRYCITP